MALTNRVDFGSSLPLVSLGRVYASLERNRHSAWMAARWGRGPFRSSFVESASGWRRARLSALGGSHLGRRLRSPRSADAGLPAGRCSAWRWRRRASNSPGAPRPLPGRPAHWQVAVTASDKNGGGWARRGRYRRVAWAAQTTGRRTALCQAQVRRSRRPDSLCRSV